MHYNKKCCTMLKPLVYEYYIVPNIEENSTGNYFTPNTDGYPDWLDYIEFYVNDDYRFMKVENNQETFTCVEGDIIIWDPVSKSIEQVLKTQDEFEENYNILK